MPKLYHCEECNFRTNQEVKYQKHMKGLKHAKQVKVLNKWGLLHPKGHNSSYFCGKCSYCKEKADKMFL